LKGTANIEKKRFTAKNSKSFLPGEPAVITAKRIYIFLRFGRYPDEKIGVRLLLQVRAWAQAAFGVLSATILNADSH
jgi:hypothetical protein